MGRKCSAIGRAGWPAEVILALEEVQVVWLIYDFPPTSLTVYFHLLSAFHETWVLCKKILSWGSGDSGSVPILVTGIIQIIFSSSISAL